MMSCVTGPKSASYTTALYVRAAMTDEELEDVESVMDHRCSELLMPSASDQRAIISSLEQCDDVTGGYVYTVSRAWYDRWRSYVGLDETARRGRSDLEPTSQDSAEDNKTATVCDESSAAATVSAAAGTAAVSPQRELSASVIQRNN